MAMNNRDRFGDTYANNTTKKMIALYDYDPQVKIFNRRLTCLSLAKILMPNVDT